MTKKTYIDFEIEIEQVVDGYRVSVDSEEGKTKSQFTLPFEDNELENFFVRIGHSRSVTHRDAHFRDQSEIETVKEFGGRLFKVIFKDEVGKIFSSSLAVARVKKKGLRIRLRLGDAPRLADVPWEYLYNPALNRFYALSVDTPIVRYLALPEGAKPLSVELPLNVLVMISNPRDCPQLDVNREWDKLKEALCDLEQKGLVKLEMLGSATLSALQHQLLKNEYHVFHFIGHGGFDKRAQDGVLVLEDEEGNGREINGQKLGTILHDERTLRLVVLNACEGARTSRTDPFAGTAQSLVQQGIPAVIAMQFEITDKAAITLSHTFYRAAARGYPVDFALAEARKAINSEQDYDSVEWGTPVLYMRSSDGHIFDIKERNILKDEAQAAIEKKDWTTAKAKWQSILALTPEDKEAKKGFNRARWMKYRQRMWIGIAAITAVLACVIFWHDIFPTTIDLAIERFSIEPETVIQGETVRVTAIVQNSGNADATNVLVKWWPVADSSLSFTDTIPEIKSEELQEITFPFPGYSYTGLFEEVETRITVYPSEDNTERNSSNNDSTMTIAVSPASNLEHIDLKIASFSIEPANPIENRQVTMTAAIHNSGDSIATNVLVEWWPDVENAATHIDTIMPEIEGGDTANIELTHSGYSSTGSITTELKVNSNEATTEGNYFNNSETTMIAVTSSQPPPDTLPDLEIASFSIEPANPIENRQVTMTAAIHNSGDSIATNVLVEWWPDVENAATHIDTIMPEIEGGDTANIELTHSGYSSAGSITTELKVNSNKAITEGNYLNNSETTMIAVTSSQPPPDTLPDLEIIGLSFEPETPKQNICVKMTLTVKNTGDSNATGVRVRWWPYADENDFEDKIIPVTINSNDTVNINLQFQYKYLGAGSVESRITINPDNDIDESNYSNNEYRMNFVVEFASGFPQ